MENAEEIYHFLEDFSKRKPKIIPQELNEYLAFVARTGDPVYQWPLVKSLFKEKLLNVITDFYETTPSIEIPPYPNVDPFNYDIMKNSLLERLDSFTSAPFTVQRICELLTFPRKQYNRIDKFMRAIEKNILVVSTREPGAQRQPEENGEANEPVLNGSDNNSEYNVDVEMEDVSWKENNGQHQSSEPQASSSDIHISVDDIEARLKAKEESSMENQDKTATQYESVTPPELNVIDDVSDNKPTETISQEESTADSPDITKTEHLPDTPPMEEMKTDVEMENSSPDPPTPTLIIPEIKVDDAEMTEQKLLEQSKTEPEKQSEIVDTETTSLDSKPILETPQVVDESSSDSKEEIETKLSEVLTSSEESSSSSDNTDASSNSPKTDDCQPDVQEESNQSDSNTEPAPEIKETEEPIPNTKPDEPVAQIQSESYSISDVKSELSPQPTVLPPPAQEEIEKEKETSITIEESEVKVEESQEPETSKDKESTA